MHGPTREGKVMLYAVLSCFDPSVNEGLNALPRLWADKRLMIASICFTVPIEIAHINTLAKDRV